MQILPSNSFNDSYGFFSSADYSPSSSFMEAMDSALDAVGNADYHSASAALEDNNAPKVESPYTRHTSNGVTYTLDEVCFTKSELQELRQALLKEGAPEESLRQFDLLAGQPDGATLAQVIASLMGKSEKDPMSEEDAHAITALLGQLDPSGKLGQDAIELMNQGNGMAALDLIQTALAQMDPASGIDIDQESMLALGRGLGLNQDSLRALLEGMGGHGSLTLNNAQLNQLLNPAKNQLLSDAANAEKLDAALEKTLKGVISKARNRMEKEKAATELQNRRVEQSKVLIDRTVQQRSRDMIDATVTGEHDDNEYALQGLAGQELRDSLRAQLQSKAQNRESVNNSQQSVNETQPMSHAHEQKSAETLKGDDRHFNQDAGRNSDKSDGWDNLLGKLSAKESRPVSNQASSIVYSMLQGNIAEEAAFTEPLQGQPLPQLPQMVASQVEQGVLRAMGNGATRLDLQLHPAELGAISITLVARNGEVTAQLRSEKSETAEMLTRQLDTLRVNLEQQGLKVDKIEVQLQDRQDQNNSNTAFDDLGQHNARQEENAFRQEVRRLRNLAGLRNIRENQNVAQDVHSINQTVRDLSQSLHVVA